MSFVRQTALSSTDLVAVGQIVLDEANNFMYCIATNRITKVRISTLTVVAVLADGTHGGNLAIDTTNGFLYFITGSTQQVKKISLTSFTIVATLALTGMSSASGRVCNIDVTNQLLYVGGNVGLVGRLAKVNLTTFTQAGSALDFTVNNRTITSAVLDLQNNKGYYSGHFRTAGFAQWGITKVDLSSMTVNAELKGADGTLNAVGGFATGYCAETIILDSVNGFIYAATSNDDAVTNGAFVLKIDTSTFGFIGGLAIPSALNIEESILSNSNGDAYFIERTSPAKVHRVKLSDFSYVDSITLNTGENVVGDPAVTGGMPINSAETQFYVSCPITPGAGIIVRIGTNEQFYSILNRKVPPYDFGQKFYQ